MNSIYLLTFYQYDYYEWEYVVGASLDREVLEALWKTLDYPLVDDEQHKLYAKQQNSHYVIVEMKLEPELENSF